MLGRIHSVFFHFPQSFSFMITVKVETAYGHGFFFLTFRSGTLLLLRCEPKEPIVFFFP